MLACRSLPINLLHYSSVTIIARMEVNLNFLDMIPQNIQYSKLDDLGAISFPALPCCQPAYQRVGVGPSPALGTFVDSSLDVVPSLLPFFFLILGK